MTHNPADACRKHLPKERRRMLGYVAACPFCEKQFVLISRHGFAIWHELAKDAK